MSDGNGPIASAVIVPEAEDSIAYPSKRRQSSDSGSTTKRRKVSTDANGHDSTVKCDSPSTKSTSPPPKDSRGAEQPRDADTNRRKSSVQEEKKRGQRLFGGLLSALNQSTPNGQQKRRLEIEKRQQEKARQQKTADEEQRATKLAELKTIRKAEQVNYEEAEMRTRHSNMLAMSNFLYTKAEPRIYYKPWELLPGDNERMKTQITDAEDIIERELAQFNSRHLDHIKKEGSVEEPIEEKTKGTVNDETMGEPQPVSPPDPVNVDTTNPPTQEPSEVIKLESKTQEEHNGEVVVEDDEDTVIY